MQYEWKFLHFISNPYVGVAAKQGIYVPGFSVLPIAIGTDIEKWPVQLLGLQNAKILNQKQVRRLH